MVFSLPQAPFSVFWEGTKKRSHGPCLQKIMGSILRNKKNLNAGGLGVGGFPAKESACNAGDLGLIPGPRRSPGQENDNPLYYSCLENPTEEPDGLQSAHTQSFQSCPTVCNPVDCGLQAPLSMGFSRQEYWSGLPFPTPRELPDPGI